MTLLWIIAALFAFALWRTWSHLGSEEERRAYAAELETGRFWDRYGEDTYRGWLKAGLDWLDRHVGLGLLNWRGLGVCLALTLGYNAALFVGGWALGFGTELVGLDVLPPATPVNRGAFAALTGLSAASLAWGVVRIRGMGRGRAVVAGLGLAFGVGLVFLAGHRLAVGVWLPVILSHFSVGVMVMAGAVHAAALLLALIFSGRARGPTIITLLGLGVAVLVSSLLGATGRDRIVVLFLVGLPLINGLFDWISWAVTRRLTRSLVDAPLTVKRITLHLALDLAVALVLAVGLTFALSLGLELAATGFSPVEIADEVVADPWGRGAWVMLMLLSTLIPTALHAGALLLAALTCRLPHAVRISRAQVLKRPIAPGDRERDWMAVFLVARWAAPLGVVALVLAVVAAVSRTGAGAAEIVLGETVRIGAAWGSSPRSVVARLEVSFVRCAQMQSSNLWAARLADHDRAALDAWEQSQRQPINDPDVFLTAGQCLNALGRYDDALTACGRAIQLDPEDARYHLQRGVTLAKMGRHADALDAFDRAILLDPDNAVSHGLRGAMLHELGRYTDALDAYDHATRLDPGNASDHRRRGGTLATMGRHADGLDAIDSAIRLAPDNAEYHLRRGSMLREVGRIAEAIAAYEEAVRLAPDNPKYREELDWLRAQVQPQSEAAGNPPFRSPQRPQLPTPGDLPPVDAPTPQPPR